MKPAPVRMSGLLTHWNDERGFGFITPTVGGPDVFVHISSFPPGAPRPVDGDEISYELEYSPDGKPRAMRIMFLSQKEAPRAHRSGPLARASRLGYLAILGFVCILVTVAFIYPLPPWVWVLYGGMNVVTFIAYLVDKRAAEEGSWRVPEASLLALGVVGGWPGAIIAQQLLRHKTIKKHFQWLFWLSVFVNVAAFVLLSWVASSFAAS